MGVRQPRRYAPRIEQGIQDPNTASSARITSLAKALNVPVWVIQQAENEPEFEFLDGHLVVDEMAEMLGKWDYMFFRVADKWYKAIRGLCTLPKPTEYQGSVKKLESRKYDAVDYLICGLVPRGGYKFEIADIATPPYIEQLMEQYPDEWSDPYELVLYSAFGSHARRAITVRRFKVSDNPLRVESQIRELGVWALAWKDYVDVRVA